MDYRSKSAQQKNIEREHYDLNKKLNWVLNQNPLPFTHQCYEDPTHSQAKPSRFQQSYIRPILRKVDSFQKVQLVKKKTAIEELQQLVTPEEREEQREQWNVKEARRSSEFQLDLYEQQSDGRNIRNEPKEIFGQQNQTVKYYKHQNNKLKIQLNAQKTKNEDYLSIIKKLQRTNLQLQKQVNLLLNKYQANNDSASRIKQLQNDFKQQLIVNLELEQLLLKKNLKIKQGASKLQNDQQRFNKINNELNQLKGKKRQADKEIRSLKEIIDTKNQEINQLNHQINKQAQDQITQNPISLHQIQNPPHSTRKDPKYLQRFLHFSKDMEMRIGQNRPNLMSTDPSLQQATTMDNEQIRKISGSDIFKGNYCSLALPIGQSKGNKPSSKTDRL